ncbi:hypothetical protein A6V39_05040 [Candidatus Mycoplasma haematobovis]|uniref:Uncharacterized protein n=1 Tax=Candidatus Mycoplasma haematobovis TaxID=432608 RepID=A0A1A9QBG1_9MOLU|nr:hypothetical protein [Candidatus Mycoplasma haematobovis]OAL09793.1 hypothetical protein A6V39_05040 [Candidatus Mycoplasma haematobovis]
MSNTLIKVGAGIVGISSVTTGSYFIRGYYNTDRIIHRINNSGMTLLNYSDPEAEWAKRWKDYVENSNNIWKLTDFDQTKGNKDQVPKSFKDKCYYSTGTAIEGNRGLLSQIERYCTKSFKITDLLGQEKGITLLKREDDPKLWKAAWDKYFENKKKNNKDPLDIKHFTNNNLPDNYKENCIKNANSEIRTKRDEKYSIVKSWCTKV